MAETLAAVRGPRSSGYALLIGIFVVSLVQIPLLRRVSPTFVRGDGVGYYAYLRSIVCDRDLDFRNEYAYFAARLPESEQSLTARYLSDPTASGRPANHWPAGTSLLWAPFFLVAHGLVLLAGRMGATVLTDGFSTPYQFSVVFATAVYAFLGLLLLYGMAKRLFASWASTVAVLTMWFATSLVAYMYFMASMSHGCSFFSVMLFLYLWQRSRGSCAASRAAVLGLAAGLMALHRLQNVMFLAAPAYELGTSLTSRAFGKRRVAAAGFAAVFCAVLALSVAPQFAAWRLIYGNSWMPSYNRLFDLTRPHVASVLFSANHGLLSWTPMVAVGLAGVLVLRGRDRLLADGLLVAFLCQLYVVSCFVDWHGDAAFGARYFIGCIPLFGLGLAALVDRLLRRGVPGIAVGSVCAAAAAWNYLLLFQYGTKMIPRCGAVSWLDVARNSLIVIPGRLLSKVLELFGG